MRPDSGEGPGTAPNLAEMVAAQARATPDAVAIIDGRNWTYGDLLDRVHRYAARLSGLDLAPETAVGVIAPRDADLVALLLALLWSGVAYVPIDPEDPPERAIRLLDAAGCDYVVGATDLLARLHDAGDGRRLPVALDMAQLAAEGADAGPVRCAPGGARLAYVLFTSGSTGEPKGVEVEHRQVVNLLAAARDLLSVGPRDRYLAAASLAFDISVVELFLPLIVGGSILLRDRSLFRDPRLLREQIDAHDVSIVQLGPSTWRLLLDHAAPERRLRVAISTGEAMAPRLAAQLAEYADETWNLYGPTETTVWCTGHRLQKEQAEALTGASVPIGMPISNCEAFVLEDDGTVTSGPAQGELLIAGKGLARGYRGRCDLTAASFPALGPNGTRTYRTGDLVRRGDDGVLHYLGRRDDQVKIGGVRIEPGEIEAALLEYPEIRAVAATWYDMAAGHRGIVVSIVWADGRPPTFEALHARLGRTLPRAMLPSRYLAMDALPLTTSGKIDRKAIRTARAHEVSETGPPVAQDMTDTEARLSMIWTSVLGVEWVDANTHFFTAGGDSLSAIRMVLDAEKVFDTDLDQGAIWNAPRLRDFARAVERARRQPDDLGNTRTVFPVVSSGRGAPLFFSNLDLRLGRDNLWQVDCPLYAIVQWSVGRGFVTAASIEDLAAAQVTDIRRVQARGPYRIGGYSMGGLIALEIARLLRASGEEVDLLFLLDPMAPARYCPDVSGPMVEMAGHRAPDTLRDLAGTLRSPSRSTVGNFLRKRVLNPICYHLVDLHGRHPSPLTQRLLPRNRWPAFWHAARKLVGTHVVRPYDGKVLAVFHDRAERFEIWRSLLPGAARFSVIETTHLGFFTDPWMGAWMRDLQDALEKDPASADQPRCDPTMPAGPEDAESVGAEGI